MKKSELKNIENLAGKEFNYEGGAPIYGSANYIGEPGEYDFSGGRSFAQEHAPNRVFSFSLVSTETVDKVVALCPAYYDTLARLALEGHSDVDAIFGDGEIFVNGGDNTKKITATSLNSGKTIFGLLEFMKRNPLRVVGMTIQSSNSAQFDQIIKIENVAPFNDLGNKQIVLSRYRPASQLATDKIDVPLINNNEVIDMNDQNLVKFPVKAGATVTVNLFIGAISNEAGKLKSRADLAHANLQEMEGRRRAKGNR